MNVSAHWMAVIGALLLATSSLAAEPIYSLDLLADHPYRFPPTFGHASQNPGSPKHFVPGYGYRIPGFGTSSYLDFGTRYQPFNAFGRRDPSSAYHTNVRANANSLGGPWFHPGWPGNRQLQPQPW